VRVAALLLSRPQITYTDAADAQLDDVRIEERPQHNNNVTVDTSSSSSSSSSSASHSTPEHQQRDQTRLTLEDMREEQEEAAVSEAAAVSVRQLKREIADCLIYLPTHLASFLEDDIKAVQALIFILHRNLLTAKEDRKKSPAATLYRDTARLNATPSADSARPMLREWLCLSVSTARRAC